MFLTMKTICYKLYDLLNHKLYKTNAFLTHKEITEKPKTFLMYQLKCILY